MQTQASLTLTTTAPLSCMLNNGATAPSRILRLSSSSLPPEKVEIFRSLEPWASKNVLPLLKPVERCWQPSDLLPDSTRPVGDFMDEVRALRERTDQLPDEYLVVLVGNMITEEALPTYQSALNSLVGVSDESGASPSPWATWIRAWSAEENRHGDLLNTYLYLSGRVDMLMIQRTVQYLIGAGMDHSNWENNPYLGFVYTSFQERATFVSLSNTARLAKEGGDPLLTKICGTIAADEKRHENAYVKIVEKLLEIDPNETMLTIGKMMRSKVVMPARLMHDGGDPHLFDRFAHVADHIGVYTSDDYAEIVESLIGRWKLDKVVEGLKGNGKCEQDFVCSLPHRIRRFKALQDERAKNKNKGFQSFKFSWIFNKEIVI